MIEEYHKLVAEPGTRHLKWSFGKSLQKSELRFGYIMKVVSPPKSHETYLEWEHGGIGCHGKYMAKSGLAVLNFFLDSSSVVATYRVLDEDSMGVCIVEVDQRTGSTIQMGNMYRLTRSGYDIESDLI